MGVLTAMLSSEVSSGARVVGFFFFLALALTGRASWSSPFSHASVVPESASLFLVLVRSAAVFLVLLAAWSFLVGPDMGLMAIVGSVSSCSASCCCWSLADMIGLVADSRMK